MDLQKRKKKKAWTLSSVRTEINTMMDLETAAASEKWDGVKFLYLTYRDRDENIQGFSCLLKESMEI